MRADMRKVLTERPRAGSHRNYHEVRQRENRGEIDDLPSYQGMSRPYGYDDKNFNDLIGPLRNFLRGCVGRRWDDVWSEICQAVPSGNTVDQHLRQHATWEVETECVIVDDEVRVRGRYGSGQRAPRGLYVDPRDGLIYYQDNPPKDVRKRTVIDKVTYICGDDGILYPTVHGRPPLKLIGNQRAMLIDGIWYWIDMAEAPPPRHAFYLDHGVIKTRVVFAACYDIITGEFVNQGRYHTDKRQMASRDLRRHGLQNIR